MGIEGGRRKLSRKGLSPVVASVLLILLVVALVAMIFLWAQGFLSEQIEKFDVPISEACSKIEFNADFVPSDTSERAIEIVNTGDVDIYNLDIKMFRGANTEFESFPFFISSGKSIKKPLTLIMEDSEDYGKEPEKIILYPSLIGSVRGKGSNKAFTCEEKGITLYLNEEEVI